jgi:hypothetical protein
VTVRLPPGATFRLRSFSNVDVLVGSTLPLESDTLDSLNCDVVAGLGPVAAVTFAEPKDCCDDPLVIINVIWVAAPAAIEGGETLAEYGFVDVAAPLD